jgi:protease I
MDPDPICKRKAKGATVMSDLQGKRAAVLIADNFQDEEGVETTAFLRERGVEVSYIGLKPGTVKGKYGRQEVEVGMTIADADPDDFDLLIVPGGAAPETLRLDSAVLDFTRRFFEEGKPAAAICHGPQVLISAQVLPGRVVTCYAGIRDDVQLAGARYFDKEVVVDRNLVTSRKPKDIPGFNEAILGVLVGETAEVGTEAGADVEG